MWNDNLSNLKQCSKCKKIKKKELFYIKGNRLDSWCISCHRERKKLDEKMSYKKEKERCSGCGVILNKHILWRNGMCALCNRIVPISKPIKRKPSSIKHLVWDFIINNLDSKSVDVKSYHSNLIVQVKYYQVKNKIISQYGLKNIFKKCYPQFRSVYLLYNKKNML